MDKSEPTLCLNMIVKNEAHIISKTLNSVLRAFNINTWVIHDTGSSDGTQQIIKDTLAHIPGKLIEKAWVDFGTNRQAALKSAEGLSTHVLFVDADQEFEGKCPDFDQDADAVTLISKLGSTLYPLISIVKNNGSWKWRGVVHEGLYEVDKSDRKKHIGPLEGITVINERGGARSKDPLVFLKDVLLLKNAIADIENGKNEEDKDLLSRYYFYTANSLRDSKLFNEAVVYYDKRIAYGGWVEEIYVSHIQKAICLEHINKTDDAIISLVNAGKIQIARAEHLYYLARILNKHSNPSMAHVFALAGSNVSKPKKGLFIIEDIYEFWIHYELALSAKKMLNNNLLNVYKKELLLRLNGRHPHLIKILEL